MMKFTLLIAFLFQALSALATDLQVGDVLLKPMDCWSCTLIEEEESTIYSHMGIIIATSPNVIVAEALGKVRQISIEDFQKTTAKGQKISVLRMNNEKGSDFIVKNQDRFRALFSSDFEGLGYDHAFLWNNLDANNRELLYCSEFVTKFLFAFMGFEFPVKRMHFNQNRDQWVKYFKGNVPDNKWGNAPADYERSDLFHQVGEL